MSLGIEGEDAGHEVGEPMRQVAHIFHGSSQRIYRSSSLCASLCLCNLNYIYWFAIIDVRNQIIISRTQHLFM